MTLLLALLALASYFAMPADWRSMFGRVADAWLAWCAQLPASLSGGLRLAICLLVPMIILAVLLQGLREVGLSLLVFMPSAVVLIAIFADITVPGAWPRHVAHWQERPWTEADMDPEQGDWVTQDVALESELAVARRELLRESLHELFSPLFWFLLATPVAALGYYVLRIAAQDADDATREPARHWLLLADWIPTRLLALSFALAGNFTATWAVIKDRLLRPDAEGHELIDEAAMAAEPADLPEDEPPAQALSSALEALQALMQRALIVWMVMLALHTLWPGA